MSLGNDPSRFSSERDVLASEALAAARQERHELGRDGPAPSVEAILREMGRGPDGYPLDGHSDDEFVPVSEAGRRALADVGETCDRCGGRGYIGGPHYATMSDCPECGAVVEDEEVSNS